MTVERSIATAAVAALGALDAVENVRIWGDVSSAPVFPEVAVQVAGTIRHQPNYDYYRSDLSVMVACQSADDESGAAADLVVAAVEDWMHSLTKDTLSITGATIDGVVALPEATSLAPQGANHIIWQGTCQIHYTRT